VKRLQSNLLFLTAFVLTLTGMTLFALGRGRVRNAEDFSVAGRQAGSWTVAGAIMGTLVGGASTIGTAQLAFLYGLSAWWFTLGAGLACLFLGLFLASPLQKGAVETIPQFISRYHGERARSWASIFSSLGMFIHIVAQLLACGALLSSLFGLSMLQAAVIASLLVALVTLRGGMRSAGPVGLLKLLLLYCTMLGAGVLAFIKSGGATGLTGYFPDFPWFSLFGYGLGNGLSDLTSMLVGVVSTQIYLQAIFSARSPRAARQGAFFSAILIPPMGLFGIAVGLYMRRIRPELDSALALPNFLLENFPPLLAGPAFAVLLFAAVGTAAGLTLGVGTTLQLDLLAHFSGTSANRLRQLRLATVGVLGAALALLLFNLGSAIMQWSFLSMGLRGATLALPLLAAIFWGEKTSRRGGALAILLGPIAVVLGGLCGWPDVPPLYLGLAVALTCLIAGKLMPASRSHR
jgi:SSS family solute:Na+ symporter